MKGSRLCVEYFQVFCDLVESKSFRQAAARNLLTQSAVSQQLAFLERSFKRKLIERGGGEFTPTEAGRLLYEGARSILETHRKIKDGIEHLSPGIAGSVRIECAYSVGLHLLPPLIRGFMLNNPQIKLEVEYAHSDRIWADILAGACDVGIGVLPDMDHPGIEARPFIEERLLFVCSSQGPRAGAKSIHLKDIAEEPFIAFDPKMSTRKTIDDIFRKRKIPLRVVREFDNIENLKQSVEVGAGVSILPETTVAQEVKNNTLAAVPIAEGPFSRQTGIVLKKGRKPSRATDALVRWLLRFKKNTP